MWLFDFFRSRLFLILRIFSSIFPILGIIFFLFLWILLYRKCGDGRFGLIQIFVIFFSFGKLFLKINIASLYSHKQKTCLQKHLISFWAPIFLGSLKYSEYTVPVCTVRFTFKICFDFGTLLPCNRRGIKVLKSEKKETLQMLHAANYQAVCLKCDIYPHVRKIIVIKIKQLKILTPPVYRCSS